MIKTQKWFVLNVCYVLLFCVFCAVLSVCLCTGRFVMVPLNLTCPHCLQHNYFKRLFSVFYHIMHHRATYKHIFNFMFAIRLNSSKVFSFEGEVKNEIVLPDTFFERDIYLNNSMFFNLQLWNLNIQYPTNTWFVSPTINA